MLFILFLSDRKLIFYELYIYIYYYIKTCIYIYFRIDWEEELYEDCEYFCKDFLKKNYIWFKISRLYVE